MKEAQLQALTETFGGPMTPKQIEFLRDVQGFIDFCIANDMNFVLAASTIAHDVNGMLTYQEAPWFRPKVAGYAGSTDQMAKIADDPDMQEREVK
jgi:hypothetical protein